MDKDKEKKEQNSKLPASPVLAHRREHRKSSFRLGRTIGAKREKLETANERQAARKKDKRRNLTRLFIVIGAFLTLTLILIGLFFSFIKNDETEIVTSEPEQLNPTIEVIDEDLASGSLTSRMNLFIARAEKEFKASGLTPLKAVIPKGSIREVDFYLEDIPGFIKTIIDRSPAVTVEDAERMIRYLREKEISDYSYIDVRIDGKAYWK